MRAPQQAARQRWRTTVLPGVWCLAVLDHDLGKETAAVAGAQRQCRGGATRQLEVGPRARRVRRCDYGRAAAVGLLADVRVERQLPQQSHAVIVRHAGTAAGTEDMLGVTTVRADVDAHVLDD